MCLCGVPASILALHCIAQARRPAAPRRCRHYYSIYPALPATAACPAAHAACLYLPMPKPIAVADADADAGLPWPGLAGPSSVRTSDSE